MESELAKRLDLPLRHGLPGWVGVVTAFMVGLPVMMINGTYTGSIQEVSGTLGALTEDITMGYYSASAGMAKGSSLSWDALAAVAASRKAFARCW